jgi:hypothetical protein
VKRHVVPQGVPDQNILQKSMADLTLTLSTASSYPPHLPVDIEVSR